MPLSYDRRFAWDRRKNREKFHREYVAHAQFSASLKDLTAGTGRLAVPPGSPLAVHWPRIRKLTLGRLRAFLAIRLFLGYIFAPLDSNSNTKD